MIQMRRSRGRIVVVMMLCWIQTRFECQVKNKKITTITNWIWYRHGDLERGDSGEEGSCGRSVLDPSLLCVDLEQKFTPTKMEIK